MSNAEAQQTEIANDQDHWADDVLGRKEVAQDFTKIINSVPSPYVISVNAGYGRGKTFFIKRWIKNLKQQGKVVFHFNAWEDDYSSEPLVAFGSNLQSQLKEANLAEDKTLKSLGLTITNILSQVMISGTDTVSFGAMSEIKEKEDEDALEKQSANVAASKVKAHNEIKNSVAALKNNLQEICAHISQEKGEEALPVYIMVDELDRCRPLFAIEFLEIIKHFFDQDQLQHAVKSVYGQGFDGQGYLRRFINLELTLPEVNERSFVDALFAGKGLKDRPSERNNIFSCPEVCIQFYSKYARLFGLSLRDIERGTNTIEIALNLMTGERQIFYPPVLGFLVAARQKDSGFYRKIGNDLTEARSVLEAAEKLSEKAGYFDTDDVNETLLEHMLIAMLAQDRDQLKQKKSLIIQEQENNSEKYKNDIPAKRNRRAHEKAMELADMMEGRFAAYDMRPPIFYLKEKIDIGAKY